MNNTTSPGPWRIKDNHTAGGVIHLAVLAANGDMPASISPMHLVRDVDRANAKLIASAPDLLARCIKMQHALEEIIEGSVPYKRDFAITAYALKLAKNALTETNNI